MTEKKEGPNVNVCPVCKGQFGDELWNKERGMCIECAKKEPETKEHGPAKQPPLEPKTVEKAITVDVESILKKIEEHEKAVADYNEKLNTLKTETEKVMRETQEKANKLVAAIKQRNGAITGLRDLLNG